MEDKAAVAVATRVVGHVVRVEVRDGVRALVGTLACVDKELNLILHDTEEHRVIYCPVPEGAGEQQQQQRRVLKRERVFIGSVVLARKNWLRCYVSTKQPPPQQPAAPAAAAADDDDAAVSQATAVPTTE
eukprot:TRINITY_DN17012_c0_g1_i1.p2 TRINITY_DN17012_c0_g1~~TRINITY_DN17012_c0_g1_i1.p2  ORF type:complete len:130 (+),score=58.39 TRINITY_DN17012_c0_g1_i1:93-482(+)